MEARLGIAATNIGVEGLFTSWFFLLTLKDLCVNPYRLRTTLGPNCTRGSPTAESSAAIRGACCFRRRKSRVNWERMTELLRQHPLPPAKIVHSIYAS